MQGRSALRTQAVESWIEHNDYLSRSLHRNDSAQLIEPTIEPHQVITVETEIKPETSSGPDQTGEKGQGEE